MIARRGQRARSAAMRGWLNPATWCC